LKKIGDTGIYNYCANRGKFINFAKIGGKFIIFFKIWGNDYTTCIIGLGGMDGLDASAALHVCSTQSSRFVSLAPPSLKYLLRDRLTMLLWHLRQAVSTTLQRYTDAIDTTSDSLLSSGADRFLRFLSGKISTTSLRSSHLPSNIVFQISSTGSQSALQPTTLRFAISFFHLQTNNVP